jgi:C-terminal processing protease CtpA/Prc
MGQEEVIKILKKHPKGLTFGEIKKIYPSSTLNVSLKRLRKAKEVKHVQLFRDKITVRKVRWKRIYIIRK